MYIFLDIDGVLNTPATFPTFDPFCVENFNKLIERTNAQLIISSSWRYLIHSKAMSLVGFQHMLFSHNVRLPKNAVIGVTKKDEVLKDRSEQILDLVRTNNLKKWIAIDDLKLNLPEGHFVKTYPNCGFTQNNTDEAIKKLTGSW